MPALTNGAAFSLGKDIDQALAELHAADALYSKSTMRFMTSPDGLNMPAMCERGATILVYHGVSDRSGDLP